MSKHLSFDVLSRMAERSLSPLEEARASRHLARCGRCRSEVGWLQRIRARPPYFLESDIELFDASRRRAAGNSVRDQPNPDWDSGAWRINQAWLTGVNQPAEPNWQRSAG